MEFDDQPLGPRRSRWSPAIVLQWVFWIVGLVTLVVVIRVDPRLSWFPTAFMILEGARTFAGVRKKTIADREAIARLEACFSESSEPELGTIFAALYRAADEPPISTAMEWSRRYQLGMITKASYYAGMREFLEKHGTARAGFFK